MPEESVTPDADVIIATGIVSGVFNERSVQYALVGGVAAIMRGRMRYTKDTDFIVQVPQIELPGVLDQLAVRGCDIDQPAVIRQYVQHGMTKFTYHGVIVDWLKPIVPLYQHVIRDATLMPWDAGSQVRVATAEGLILCKLVAFRPQDQLDIHTLLVANRDEIDLGVIREEWSPYAAEYADRTAWLEQMIAKHVTAKTGRA